MDVLEEMAEIISKKHLDKPKQEAFFAIFPKAINAYLQSLDPHSKYLTAAEYQRFKEQQSKGYIGIGASIKEDKQGILIIPFPQSPAFKAGIKVPHILQAVNDIAVDSMTISAIVALLQDSENTFVTLKTRQLFDNKQIIHKTTLKRKPYRLEPIHQLSDDYGIPYIRINKFISRKTLFQLKTALQRFKKQAATIVIDLRETTGGNLYETLDCLSLFLPAKKLLATTVNNQSQKNPFYSLAYQIIHKKILLLVGPRTASSAEIFAKALQYYQKAVLIGQKTYGKCLSQTYIELSDGSALKLSNLKILYPDNTYCHGEGLTPDIIVNDKQLYETHTLISKGKKQIFQRAN